MAGPEQFRREGEPDEDEGRLAADSSALEGEGGVPSPEPPKITITPETAEALRRSQFDRISLMSGEDLAKEGKRLFGEDWQGPGSRVRNALREEWDSLNSDIAEAARKFSEEERERAQEAIASRAAPEVPARAPEAARPAAPETPPKRGFLAGVQERFGRKPKEEKKKESKEEKEAKKRAEREAQKAEKEKKAELRFTPSKRLREILERNAASNLVEGIDKASDDKLKGLADVYLDGKGKQSGSPAQIRERLKRAISSLEEEKAGKEATGAVLDEVVSQLPQDVQQGIASQDRREILSKIGHKLEETKIFGNTLVKLVWDRKAEIATGAVAGFITRTALRTALGGPVGFVAGAGVGALGGGVAGGVREVFKQKREYSSFMKEVRGEGQKLTPEQFAKRSADLKARISQETDLKKREIAKDQLRYLQVELKREAEREKRKEFEDEIKRRKQELKSEKDSKKRKLLQAGIVSLEKGLKPTLASGSHLGPLVETVIKLQQEGVEDTVPTEREKLIKEIMEAKAIDKRKLLTAIGRGAAFGAIGGAVGVGFADWAKDNLDLVKIREMVPAFGGVTGFRPGAAEVTPGAPTPSGVPSVGEAPTPTPSPTPSITPSPTEAPGTPHPGVPNATESPSPTPSPSATETPSARPSAVETPSPKPGATETPAPKPSPSEAPGAKPSQPPGEAPKGEGPETGTPKPPPVSEGAEPPKPAEPEVKVVVPKPAEVVLSTEIKALPETVKLPSGSNPWNEVAGKLKEVLHRDPTNAEILQVTKAVAKESGIKVPEWGLNEGTDQRFLPPGFELKFTPGTKTLLQQIAEGKAPPEVSQAPVAEVAPKPPVTEVVTKGPPLSSEVKALPATFELKKGADGWIQIKSLLSNTLAQDPTNVEVTRITKAVAEATGIDLPRYSGAIESGHLLFDRDFNLKFTPEIKGMIQQLIDSPSLSPKIEALPEFVNLPGKTDGLATIEKLLDSAMKEAGVTRKPTRGELSLLAKAIAKASGIDPNQVQIGKTLVFPTDRPLRLTPAVKGIIQRIIDIKST